MALYKLNHGSKHEQNHRKYNQNPPDPHPNVPSWISTRGRSLCCPVSPSRHGYFLFVFNNHDKEKRELDSKTGRNSTFSCHSETNNTLRLSASRCKKKSAHGVNLRCNPSKHLDWDRCESVLRTRNEDIYRWTTKRRLVYHEATVNEYTGGL